MCWKSLLLYNECARSLLFMNIVTVVPKPVAKKCVRRHAASTNTTCGAGQIAHRSPPDTTPSPYGPQRLEQEDQFRLLDQGQEVDRRVIRSLLGWEVTPDTASTISHIPLIKTTLRRLWTFLRRKRRRPVRLIPLLSGEAQEAAQPPEPPAKW